MGDTETVVPVVVPSEVAELAVEVSDVPGVLSVVVSVVTAVGLSDGLAVLVVVISVVASEELEAVVSEIVVVSEVVLASELVVSVLALAAVLAVVSLVVVSEGLEIVVSELVVISEVVVASEVVVTSELAVVAVSSTVVVDVAVVAVNNAVVVLLVVVFRTVDVGEVAATAETSIFVHPAAGVATNVGVAKCRFVLGSPSGTPFVQTWKRASLLSTEHCTMVCVASSTMLVAKPQLGMGYCSGSSSVTSFSEPTYMLFLPLPDIRKAICGPRPGLITGDTSWRTPFPCMMKVYPSLESGVN